MKPDVDLQEKTSVSNKETQWEAVYEKTAELNKRKQQTEQIEKDNHTIRNSRLWKFSKIVRWFVRLLTNMKLMFKSTSLQAENIKLKAMLELYEEEQLIRQDNQQRATKLEISDSEERAIARTITNAGELLAFIEEETDKKQRRAHTYSRILKHAMQRLTSYDDPDIRRHLNEKITAGFRIDPMPEYLIRMSEQENIPLRNLDSFTNNLIRNHRKKQLNGSQPEQLLDNKFIAYQFIDALDVRRPKQSEKTYLSKDIPKQKGMVVKPVDGAGSRGVYLIYSLTHIVDVKRSTALTSWPALLKQMATDLQSGDVKEDNWYTEELIMESDTSEKPAKDLKFYSFYGEIGLILEIDRFPVPRYCWWDATGKRVATGKYDNDLFIGEGVTNQEIAEAARISKQIPAPFMRIDFLKTKTDLVFGEFTPKPGNFDEFSAAIDQQLGQLYLNAENRLMDDLITGKIFDHYQTIRHYN